VEAGLNIDWAAENLLSPERLQAYETATEEAWRTYETAKAEAFYHGATEDTE
jgi:hypothetical protein